jgi:hypothetical protein
MCPWNTPKITKNYFQDNLAKVQGKDIASMPDKIILISNSFAEKMKKDPWYYLSNILLTDNSFDIEPLRISVG